MKFFIPQTYSLRRRFYLISVIIHLVKSITILKYFTQFYFIIFIALVYIIKYNCNISLMCLWKPFSVKLEDFLQISQYL